MRHQFPTTLIVAIGADNEQHEVSATITFSVTPGYADSYDEPGAADQVNIYLIRTVYGTHPNRREEEAPAWLYGLADADNGLRAEMLCHAYHQDEAERDHAADMTRDERMLGDAR